MRISPLRSYKPGGSSLPVQKRFKNERNSLSPVLTATVLAGVTLDYVHYLLLLLVLLLIIILTCALVYMHAKV